MLFFVISIFVVFAIAFGIFCSILSTSITPFECALYLNFFFDLLVRDNFIKEIMQTFFHSSFKRLSLSAHRPTLTSNFDSILPFEIISTIEIKYPANEKVFDQTEGTKNTGTKRNETKSGNDKKTNAKQIAMFAYL